MALSLDSCIRFNSASMILATASVMRTDFWQLQCTDEFAFLANEKLHPECFLRCLKQLVSAAKE